MDEFIKDKHPYLEDFAEVQRVEGITDDYVWYKSKILTNKMSEWQLEFGKVVGVMEDRHKEHLKIISNLLEECKKLKESKNTFTVAYEAGRRAERELILDMCKEGLWDGEGIKFHLEKLGK